MSSSTDIRMVEAFRWLQNREAANRPSPVIPELRRRFALSPFEAIRVIRVASLPDMAGGAK